MVAMTAGPAAAIVGRTRDVAGTSVVMVLGREGARASVCSGVVVGPRAVLTAAHCVHAPGNTRVHFRDAQGQPVLMEVARVVRHPGYRSDAVTARAKSIDLAIVVTRDNLPARFSPAILGTASDEIGTSFTIAGYGLAREGDAASSGVLREGAVALSAPVSGLLLWLTGPAGACTGDSGGPVFGTGGEVVAIIAFAQGVGATRCGALTQAVRVAPFRDWVETSVAAQQ